MSSYVEFSFQPSSHTHQFFLELPVFYFSWRYFWAYYACFGLVLCLRFECTAICSWPARCSRILGGFPPFARSFFLACLSPSLPGPWDLHISLLDANFGWTSTWALSWLTWIRTLQLENAVFLHMFEWRVWTARCAWEVKHCCTIMQWAVHWKLLLWIREVSFYLCYLEPV